MTYPYENLENFTLKALLDRSVKLFAQEDALGFVNEDMITYSEVNKRVQSMVKLLQDYGITSGDKVVLLSQNMPNWAVAYFSITYFGAVVVPVLPDFHKSDVHHILRHSEAKAVFVSNEHLSTIQESSDSQVRLVIKLDNLEVFEELTQKSYISQLKDKIKLTQKEATKPNENDLASLIYTSGTTGHSKGVMLSHKNLVTNALSSFEKLDLSTADVALSLLPLAHTFECTVGMTVPLLHGASIHYIKKPPTPSVLMKALAVVKPTMVLSVPLIIEKIYKNKILSQINSSFITRNLYKISFFRKLLNKMAGKKLLNSFGGRLRFFGIGGAALSKYVEQFLYEAQFPYVIGYGLTETAPMLSGGTILFDRTKIYSAGTPMYGVELKIHDGEILAKSPSIMMGYYKDKEQTDEVFLDGWFRTGDLGNISEDGHLFISGRSKSVIIGQGGENIFPEQIEATINQNKIVLDSLVMMSDSKLIAKLHLDYEMVDKQFNPNNKKSEEKIRKDIEELLETMRIKLNSQVSSYSRILKFVEQTEPFIKTPTKKIKRFLYAT